MIIQKRGWLPYLVYGLLSLCILGPLLLPGYVLNLDLFVSPSPHYTNYFYGLSEWFTSIYAINSASTPFFLVVQAVSSVIPAWVVQKLSLFLILFVAGLGAHKLFASKGTGAYFAGIIYMINPFTYVRFLAGQWGVLASYAMFPFAIKAFFELLEKADRKSAIKVALFSTLVGLLQLHGFFLLLLAFLVIFVVKAIKERKALARFSHTCKYLGAGAALFFALNFYWLLPLLTAKRTIVSQIGEMDLLFFAPKPTSALGVAFDTASMYGFWRGGYVYAKDFIPIWWLLFMFILFLVIYGFRSSFNDKNQGWVVISFGAIGVVSFLLALGASAQITRLPFEWLWEHVPLLRGFRDSQKFVALLCLAYAYLGGLGVNEFTKMLRQQRKRLGRIGMMTLVAVALVTPLVYSFTMFGFHGQLKATDYPQEWYQVNDYLKLDEDDFNVLFLPWHMYMDYSWLPNKDKRLGNPAQQFFDKLVIQGDNIEVPGIYSQSTNPISKYVEFLLRNGNDVNNLGELLAPLNVKYVIMVHEADYRSYDFLYRQEDLRVDLEKPGITLFVNKHPVARVYAVDSVVYINSLEEYLELSRAQDVMEHLYILGSGLTNGESDGMQVPCFAKDTPLRYKVEGTRRNYTIFTVPQNVSTEYWEFNGQQPVAKNLGFMPAFKSEESGGELVYRRFYRVYLPSYVVSTIALALMLWLYFRRPKPAQKPP